MIPRVAWSAATRRRTLTRGLHFCQLSFQSIGSPTMKTKQSKFGAMNYNSATCFMIDTANSSVFMLNQWTG